MWLSLASGGTLPSFGSLGDHGQLWHRSRGLLSSIGTLTCYGSLSYYGTLYTRGLRLDIGTLTKGLSAEDGESSAHLKQFFMHRAFPALIA